MRSHRGGRCAIALLTMATAALAVAGTAAAAPARTVTVASSHVTAATVAGFGAKPVASPALASDTTFDGCRRGYVCIYDHDNQPPKATDHHTDYYNYGTYNFSHLTGWHDVVNNQTNGAYVDFCYGYNGTSCHWYTAGGGTYATFIGQDRWDHIYFTPIDSMRLCKGYRDC